VDEARGKAIDAILRDATGLSNRERLARTANAIAAGSKPEYRGDVLSRRAAIAAGAGAVHGAAYGIVNWGLDDVAIADRDLA
jgi:hypothetical protein